METADLLVIFAVLCAVIVNRQSLIFLCAFVLCEIFYWSPLSGFWYCILMCVFFALLAFINVKIKHNLLMALVCYSFLFWVSAIDYAFFPQETIFYVIFPYVIKFIDVYVIFHLLTKEGQGIGAYYRPFSGAWFQRLAGL